MAHIAELEASKAEIPKELEEAMRKSKQLEVSLTRVKEQNAKADDANRNMQKQVNESRIAENQAKSQRDEARAVCYLPIATFFFLRNTSLERMTHNIISCLWDHL